MKFDAVIFDLDGTLMNTLGDIRNAANSAMDVFGLPRHSIDAVRMFVGNGVGVLMRRALPADASDADIAKALAAFKAYYDTHLDVETCPYPGVMEMLKKLNSAGLKVCVNSNKYDGAVQRLCRSHIDGLYFKAAGESESNPRKPDPTAALNLAAACGARPERTLYVGDSNVDIHTAANAGMTAAWVSWGFRSREDMGDELPENCFDTPEELTRFILG